MADFRETYRLNTWEMDLGTDDTTDEVLRAAALAYQLPRDGRVMRTLVPTAANGPDLQVLRAIEHDVRGLAWGLGGGKGAGPEPMRLPGEEELETAAIELQASRAPGVAALLGLTKDDIGPSFDGEVADG